MSRSERPLGDLDHGRCVPGPLERDDDLRVGDQERAQRRGLATRAGERPAPWTLPQNLIDEARALADGRIPLPEPERVPWDVLIAQAVNWDIPERLAA